MLVLLFLLSTWSDMCHSQIVYMPRYVMRPVRRSSAMDALERLRLPVARYFPQVDTQAASYQAPYLSAGYPVGEPVYGAAPPQWMEDYGQQVAAPADEEEGDYGNNYEYPDFNIYRSPSQFGEEVYAQEPVVADNYNSLMDRYLSEEPREDMFDIQRRSGVEKEPEPEVANANSTTTISPLSSTQKVQMTAVPPAPEKKGMKSLVVPDQVAERDDEAGQKEEPLFRPLQSSQRTMWKGGAPQRKAVPQLNVM